MKCTYGYARVSTESQELNRQLDRLENYNCDEILTEKMSGVKASRPQLDKLKEVVQEGDTIVVESWSKLGRSTKDLLELVDFFSSKNVQVISEKEKFDTSTPQGKAMSTVFQAFAEFERDLIVERTKEGLKSARARGRVGGRPKVPEKKIEQAISLYDTKQYSGKEIHEITGISSSTLYRYLERRKYTH